MRAQEKVSGKLPGGLAAKKRAAFFHGTEKFCFFPGDAPPIPVGPAQNGTDNFPHILGLEIVAPAVGDIRNRRCSFAVIREK